MSPAEVTAGMCLMSVYMLYSQATPYDKLWNKSCGNKLLQTRTLLKTMQEFHLIPILNVWVGQNECFFHQHYTTLYKCCVLQEVSNS